MIRLVSFGLAALFTAVGFAWSFALKAQAAETALTYTYWRSLAELADYVDNIDASLEKTLCSGTDEGTVLHAAKVWREAAAAKACLSAMPTVDGRLDQTSKFLSQVGEYSYSLANRATAGRPISQEERETLTALSGYAATLREHLHGLIGDLTADGYLCENLMDQLIPEEEGGNDSFTQMDGSYEDYPSLIYDGPFSDHLIDGESKALTGRPDITEEEAVSLARRWTGDRLNTCIGKREGAIPVYVFDNGSQYLEITVKGGYGLIYNDDRDVLRTQYGVGEGLEAAREFLQRVGLKNMTDTYYVEDGNTLLINFAATQGDAVCYADLIKVTVAMDDLSIIGYEAAGYLSNHTTRDKPATTLSAREAMERISPYLTVESGQMAFVCPGGLTEYYAYEFQCRSETDRQVLVYIDAVTGREVDLLLLLETPGGTLTI